MFDLDVETRTAKKRISKALDDAVEAGELVLASKATYVKPGCGIRFYTLQFSMNEAERCGTQFLQITNHGLHVERRWWWEDVCWGDDGHKEENCASEEAAAKLVDQLVAEKLKSNWHLVRSSDLDD